MVRHTTMRGKSIDFNKIKQTHGKMPALGNASVNARGDLINNKGVILKTQEQIHTEWAKRKAENEEMRSVDIKQDLPKMQPLLKNNIPNVSNIPVKQEALQDDTDFEPIIAPIIEPVKKHSRKIVDGE